MKCPACGYTDQKQKQTSEAQIIYEDFPKDLKEQLIKIGKTLRPFMHSAKIKREWNQFMYGIQDIDYSIVRTTINQYLINEYHKQGKGFPYLKFMVIASAKNHKKNVLIESKRFGSNPPEIKIKGDNNETT
tara:strand:+ start:1072 stop:1464 length:393 start_codon:yes stop_codon:yes gene_type:complete